MNDRSRSVLILSIDSSGPHSSVALADAGGVLDFECLEPGGPGRREQLPEAIEILVERAGRSVAQVTGLGVVVGPGSYTGLRVGLALARGLALVDDLPVVGVGSLELMAQTAPPAAGSLAVAIDASHGNVYLAGYGPAPERDEVHAPQVVAREAVAEAIAGWGAAGQGPPGDTAAWRLCIDSSLAESNSADTDERGPEPLAPDLERVVVPDYRAGRLAELAAQRIAAGQGVAAARVLPAYVGAGSARKNRHKVVLGG